MASKLEIKKHELSEFNNSTGNKYEENDGVQPDAINYTIENSEYAVKYSEALASQPDISEVSTEGTPSVNIVDNPDAGIDGAKKFKFSHLKGDKGNPVWVRYAQNNAGLGMTDTPTQDTKYVGFYVGSSAPSDASAITWSKYIGKSPSSVTLEGITFTITYDDGTSDTVQIDTSLCKVTTPITGIVTSVNGQDGAVNVDIYEHYFTYSVVESNEKQLWIHFSVFNTSQNQIGFENLRLSNKTFNAFGYEKWNSLTGNKLYNIISISSPDIVGGGEENLDWVVDYVDIVNGSIGSFFIELEESKLIETIYKNSITVVSQ